MQTARRIYGYGRLLQTLHCALERMFILTGTFHDQCNLGFSNFVWEYTAYPDALGVDTQHDLGRHSAVLVEKCFQDHDHKFHRSVIVVVKQNPEQVGRFGLDLALCHHRRTAVS